MADLFDISIDTNRRKTDFSSSSDEEKPSGRQTHPLRYPRSRSPTVAGSKPTKDHDVSELSPLDTVEPTPNTSDRKYRMTDTDLAGHNDSKSAPPKKSVTDTRPDLQTIRVNEFHHFYWLAATPTALAGNDRSPAPGRGERERKEDISFTLDNRILEQSIAQMQTHLQKKKQMSQRAYARCPSHSLSEVETWVAEYKKRGEGDWFRKLAELENERLVNEKTKRLEKIEEEYRLAKQREKTMHQEQTVSKNERLTQGVEVLKKEEEYRMAQETLGRLVTEQLARRERERPVRRTDSEARRGVPHSDDPGIQESPDEHRSGSRTSSSSAEVSARSPSCESTNPAIEAVLPDEETAKAILKLSKQLFAFFFPLAYSSSMTDKYWGGVFRLLHDKPASIGFQYEYQEELLKIRSHAQPLARLIRLGPPPGHLSLPIELSRAWIHLLTFWSLSTTNRSIRTLEGELGKCLKMIEVGRSKLLRSRLPSSLDSHEAVLPAGIVSLLVNKTVGEVMGGSPDIGATYYAYLTQLEQDVQQKPYNRGHQEKLSSVGQEISCVLAVLEDQERCVRKLRSTLMRGRLNAPLGFPQRREAYILQNCLLSISDRMQTFNALDERARGIAAFSNRDRQEGAILIFTIVTIIFLPLSFVSSFFGMNTSDIRAMSTPQWAFWAAAIPLTLIVLGVSFFVARKIEPLKDIWHSLSDRWRTKPAAGGFYPAPAVQTRQLYAAPHRMATGLNYSPIRPLVDDRARRRHAFV
ncbi:MAG: hypothetical protein Q9207_006301 [Kuettlingeria erythrocarpa]